MEKMKKAEEVLKEKEEQERMQLHQRRNTATFKNEQRKVTINQLEENQDQWRSNILKNLEESTKKVSAVYTSRIGNGFV